MLITSTISGAHPDTRLCPAFPTEGKNRFPYKGSPGNPALIPCSSLGTSETELGLLTVPSKVGRHVHQKRRMFTHSAGETESHEGKTASDPFIRITTEPHTPHLV